MEPAEESRLLSEGRQSSTKERGMRREGRCGKRRTQTGIDGRNKERSLTRDVNGQVRLEKTTYPPAGKRQSSSAAMPSVLATGSHPAEEAGERRQAGRQAGRQGDETGIKEIRN